MNNHFIPTRPENRIELLDVLRGFAILGVLLSNIIFFSGLIFTPFTQLKSMSMPGLNNVINIIVTYAIAGKFYPILMLLFGAGLYMQFQKRERQGFLNFFIRRMILLFLIGGIHLTFWAGDVVSVYALYAFLLIPIKNLKPKKYFIIAISMFILHFVVAYIQIRFDQAIPAGDVKRIAYLELPGVDPVDLIATVQNDGLKGLRFITGKQLDLLWSIKRYVKITPNIFLLFTLGGYLFGSGFFTDKMHKVKYLIIFLTIGVLGSCLMHYVSSSFKIIDNLFLALAYMSLLALLMRKTKGRQFLKPLALLGRMALTNYIMQSIICILIFYGVGLGYFSKLPLYQIYLIAILILMIQIQFSNYWLTKYSFGPLETIWRRLSYGRMQLHLPIRMKNKPSIN